MDKIIIDDQVGENNFALGRVKTLVIVEMEHKLWMTNIHTNNLFKARKVVSSYWLCILFDCFPQYPTNTF